MALDPARLNEIVRPHNTVSGRIRALAAAGVSRADIARFLGKRYQHVRNVLEGDAVQGGVGGYVLGKADLSGVSEGAAIYAPAEDPSEIDRRSAESFWLRLRPDGSLPLPSEVVEALGAAPGRRVFATVKDGRLEIIGAETAMRQAQDLVRRYIPAGANVVDDFIAGRRAMWGETDD
jgi:hypothetical protein